METLVTTPTLELVKCGLAQKHHRLKPLRLIQPIEDFLGCTRCR